jgi:hypothetical protein
MALTLRRVNQVSRKSWPEKFEPQNTQRTQKVFDFVRIFRVVRGSNPIFTVPQNTFI